MHHKKLIVNTVLLLVVSQGIFWLALALAESQGRPDAFPEPTSIPMTFADINGDRIPDSATIRVPRIAEPGYLYIDDERHPRAFFEHEFDLDDTQIEYGLMLGWDRRIMEVRLNGLPLKTQSPVDIWGILGGHESVVYSFPPEYLQQGTNKLEFLSSGLSRKIMPYFFVGGLSDLYAANTWLRMFSVDLVVVSIGVLLFAILLNLLTHWSKEDKRRVTTLNVLLGAWTLRNLTFLGIDGGLPDPFRLLFHFIVTYAFLFAFLVFALGWTGYSSKSFRWPALGLAVSIGVATVAMTFPPSTMFAVAFWLETAITLAIGLTALVLFARYWTNNERAETIEIVLFLVCAGAIVTDAIDDRWQIAVPFTDIPLTFYAAPMCGLLLALGMVASLAARATRARIATENVNELLTDKLQQQEERLNESHEREKQIDKQKTLVDERQRIIRDMHDGVGGSMMSLLLRAKRNELSNENLVRSLSASMNDLRLIIDSFDHVGDNLEFALSVFRQRVEPELSASGVTLHYETSAAEAITGFGPESVLQIYRILQEACNNAVNHGDARHIFVELAADFASRQVSISITDDGKGFDPDKVSKGRGLDNLKHRAQRIGGTIKVCNRENESGTIALLTFPMRA